MTRHHVELSHKDGKRQLLIDGVPLKGVQSTTVTVAYNEPCPLVTVTFRPADVIVTGDAAISGTQKVGLLFEDTSTHAEPRQQTHVYKIADGPRTYENGVLVEHPILAEHPETDCPTDCPYRKF